MSQMNSDSDIDDLKAKTYRLGDLSPGSIQERWKKCGDPDCRCADGDKHGPYYYLAFTDRQTGKTTNIYLNESEVAELQERIDNYARFKDDLHELVEREAERRKST